MSTPPATPPATPAATPASTPAPAQPQAKFSEITLWFHAFIPDHKVDGPPMEHCFRGDDRGFSTDQGASSRLHASCHITGLGTGSASLGTTDVHCGESHQVDCDSDAVLASATATPDGGFHDLSNGDNSVVTVKLTVTAANPLISVAPHVGVDLTIHIDPINATVAVTGVIDHYPAFEGYAAAPGLTAGAPLFQVSPDSSNPMWLMLPRNVGVDVNVSLS